MIMQFRRGSENHPDTEQEEEVISSPEFKSELVLLSNAVEKVKESLESRYASMFNDCAIAMPTQPQKCK